MALSTWFFVLRAERHRIQTQFEAEMALVNERISKRMEAHEQILRGAAEFVSPGVPTRQQWHHYVESLELNRLNPGVQGLGFAEWIPDSEREAHVGRLRAEGFADYEIHPGGPLPPEGGFSSIIYLEPMDERNQRAFSRDMYAESVRRAAMARARDMGLVTLTSLVKLYQETSTQVQAGTLLYAPVYRRGEPVDTLLQRRKAFMGWVYMPFRMQNLLDGILGNAAQGIALELFDGDSQRREDLLYARNPLPEGSRSPWSKHLHFEVVGQVWTLRCAPRPEFIAAFGGGSHYVVLILGLFFSLFISLLLWHLERSERKAVAVADASLDE